MNFDRATIGALVKTAADKLLPGWGVTFELVKSIANGGALASIKCLPERKLAHLRIAAHPPNESAWESICHEMTHGAISPLASLVESNRAAILIEEQVVELLGNIIAEGGDMADAVISALRTPRLRSPMLRKRISALATRRRNEGKTRMADGKKLAELAMKAGELGAREDVPEDVRALLAEFVAELAGGGDGAVEELNKDAAAELDKTEPVLREADMPPKMRTMFRGMAAMHSSTLASTIGLRVHELRTVDKLAITPVIETRLRKASSIEDFEDRLELVKLSLGSAGVQRNRSGVLPDESDNKTHGHSIASLVKDGHSEEMAAHIVSEFKRDKDHGDVALSGAMKFRKVAKNG